MATGTQQQWFPNAANGITLSLQQVFQRVLTFVYANRTNISTLQAQVSALQALQPTTAFPLHFNSQGVVGQTAFNPATGDQFFCYFVDPVTKAVKWVRLGPSGTSTSF